MEGDQLLFDEALDGRAAGPCRRSPGTGSLRGRACSSGRRSAAGPAAASAATPPGSCPSSPSAVAICAICMRVLPSGISTLTARSARPAGRSCCRVRAGAERPPRPQPRARAAPTSRATRERARPLAARSLRTLRLPRAPAAIARAAALPPQALDGGCSIGRRRLEHRRARRPASAARHRRRLEEPAGPRRGSLAPQSAASPTGSLDGAGGSPRDRRQPGPRLQPVRRLGVDRRLDERRLLDRRRLLDGRRHARPAAAPPMGAPRRRRRRLGGSAMRRPAAARSATGGTSAGVGGALGRHRSADGGTPACVELCAAARRCSRSRRSRSRSAAVRSRSRS